MRFCLNLVIACVMILIHSAVEAQVAFSYDIQYGDRALGMHIIYPSAVAGRHHLFGHLMTTKLRHMSPAEVKMREQNGQALLRDAEKFIVQNASEAWQDTPGGQRLMERLQFNDGRSSYAIVTEADKVIGVLRCQTRRHPNDPLLLNERLGLPTPVDQISNRFRSEWMLMAQEAHDRSIMDAVANVDLPPTRLAATESPQQLLSVGGMTAALMNYNLDKEAAGLFPLILATMEAHGALSYSAHEKDGFVVTNDLFELDTHGEARIRLFKALGFEEVGNPIPDPDLKGAETVKLRATRERLMQRMVRAIRMDAERLNRVRFNSRPLQLDRCLDLASQRAQD
jgi:hypothetical protein